MQTVAPSLDFLRDELDRARFDLVRADYCESTERRDREAADARRRIASLTEQLSRIEETI